MENVPELEFFPCENKIIFDLMRGLFNISENRLYVFRVTHSFKQIVIKRNVYKTLKL